MKSKDVEYMKYLLNSSIERLEERDIEPHVISSLNIVLNIVNERKDTLIDSD